MNNKLEKGKEKLIELKMKVPSDAAPEESIAKEYHEEGWQIYLLLHRCRHIYNVETGEWEHSKYTGIIPEGYE
jgi:hypothetical protein